MISVLATVGNCKISRLLFADDLVLLSFPDSYFFYVKYKPRKIYAVDKYFYHDNCKQKNSDSKIVLVVSFTIAQHARGKLRMELAVRESSNHPIRQS